MKKSSSKRRRLILFLPLILLALFLGLREGFFQVERQTGPSISTILKEVENDYGEERLARLGWGRGTFPTREASLDYHYWRHREELGVETLEAYLEAALECKLELEEHPHHFVRRRSSGKHPAHKYKEKKGGRFLILEDRSGDILSFGR